MARAPFILLLFSLLTTSFVPSNCKNYDATHPTNVIHASGAGSQLELSRRQLRQAPAFGPTHAPIHAAAPGPTQAPNQAPDYAVYIDGNIVLVCFATRYPSSCLVALLTDDRSKIASTPQALMDLVTAIAMERVMQVGLTDTYTLDSLVSTANNDNLTAASAGCLEHLDMVAYLLQRSHAELVAAGATQNVRAWLGAGLTHSYDCYHSLETLRATLPAGLEFVTEMAGRGNTTMELISNSLALVDAELYYGPDATLWKPPPETREEQLARIETLRFPDWMGEANRAVFHGNFNDAITPNVMVAPGSSIQAAVNHAPSWSPTRYVIHIKAGLYNETVRIPKEKTNLMFLGDGSNVTIITGNLHVQSPGITTWSSATVAVNGNGFIAKGITFENTAGPEQHQAVALRVASDHSAFHACSILGHQDSLYTHSLRQFYKDCTIAGTVDFIFGNSAAVFQSSKIIVRPREGREGKSTTTYLTAQGRTDPGQATALVFQNCSVDGTPEYNAKQKADPGLHHVFLGRPWKNYSRTVFADTLFSLTLQPEGWSPWNGSFALETLLDAEYDNFGPGVGNETQRANFSSQLTFFQVQSFSAANLLQANTWLNQTTIPYSPFI